MNNLWNSSRATKDKVVTLHAMIYVTFILLAVLAFLANVTVLLVWKKHSGFSVLQNSFNLRMAIVNLYACIMVAVTFLYHWSIPIMSEDTFYSSWFIVKKLLISRTIPFLVNYTSIAHVAFIRFWEVKFPSKTLPKRYYIVSQLLTFCISVAVGGYLLYSDGCWSYIDMCLMLENRQTETQGALSIRTTVLSVVTFIFSGFLLAGFLHHRKMRKLDPYTLDSIIMIAYKQKMPEELPGPSRSYAQGFRKHNSNIGKATSSCNSEEVTIHIMSTVSSRRTKDVSTQPVFKQVTIRNDKPMLRRLLFIFMILIIVFILSIIQSIVVYNVQLNRIEANMLLILAASRTLLFAFIPCFYFYDDGKYFKVLKSVFICKCKKRNLINPHLPDVDNYI